MLIYNGIVHLPNGAPLENGFVSFEKGKILRVGKMEELKTMPGEDDLDAKGGHIVPGFIDAHTHLGMFGNAVGFEAEDGNEATDPCTPHLRAIDAINPMDYCFEEARKGGVTTVLTGPGSANPIAGQFAAIKTEGRIIDRMVVKAPVAMKFALGENPKNVYNDRHETPVTRMATAAIMRENLLKAKEYLESKEKAEKDPEEDAPEFDMVAEALIPVLKKEVPVHFHAHRADDIVTAIRIAEEFGINYVIVHGTEGYRIADYLAEKKAPVITGPCLTDRSKPELSGMIQENPALLSKAGVKIAICTDHPETPVQYLPICAAMAVKHGMDREEALRAITCYPAEIAGIYDRVGSLEAGKDADIAVFEGEPLDVFSTIKAVFINGKKVAGETR